MSLRAISRFCWRLRVCWQVMRVLVGMCTSSTFVDSLLMAWPPGPEPRIKRSCKSRSSRTIGRFFEPSVAKA